MVRVREIVSLTGLTGDEAPLAPDGVASFDSSGRYVAVEATGQRIVMIDSAGGDPGVLSVFEASVAPLSALALHAGALLLAAGAADGSIALQDAGTGEVRSMLAIKTQKLTALAFSPGGSLLAAADADGHIVVFETASGQKIRTMDAKEQTRAVALPESGFPVLIGGEAGRVSVRRRILPPAELAGSGPAVTSLVFPAPTVAYPLVGRADGTIGKIEAGYQVITPYLEVGSSPVRALWAGSRGQVKAVSADGDLWSWTRENEIGALAGNPPEILHRLADQLTLWWRELQPLVSEFAEVREQMRDDIAAERAEMLDLLTGLDKVTKDRIRPVVVASAVSLFDSYSFDLAIRKIFDVNPLPAWMLGAAGLVLFVLLVLAPATALVHLHNVGAWCTVMVIFLGGAWVMRRMGRFGAPGRLLRATLAAASAVAALAGTRIEMSEPAGLRHLATRWFPAAAHLRLHMTLPYTVWLGAAYLTLLVVVTTVGRLALRYLRAPSEITQRRRVLGGSLLHALLDVAYQAQLMASDGELAASRAARQQLHLNVQLAAHTASREWVTGLRTGSPPADRIIREQGRAIAAAITHWERRAVLAGAQLPALSNAFAAAVVYAADSDWQALAADSAHLPARHRTRALVRQGLALAVPLGAAAGIVGGVRPLPAALVPLLTFLIGIAVARVLRWLDFSSDIDPGHTISELLRKP